VPPLPDVEDEVISSLGDLAGSPAPSVPRAKQHIASHIRRGNCLWLYHMYREAVRTKWRMKYYNKDEAAQQQLEWITGTLVPLIEKEIAERKAKNIPTGPVIVQSYDEYRRAGYPNVDDESELKMHTAVMVELELDYRTLRTLELAVPKLSQSGQLDLEERNHLELMRRLRMGMASQGPPLWRNITNPARFAEIYDNVQIYGQKGLWRYIATAAFTPIPRYYHSFFGKLETRHLLVEKYVQGDIDFFTTGLTNHRATGLYDRSDPIAEYLRRVNDLWLFHLGKEAMRLLTRLHDEEKVRTKGEVLKILAAILKHREARKALFPKRQFPRPFLKTDADLAKFDSYSELMVAVTGIETALDMCNTWSWDILETSQWDKHIGQTRCQEILAACTKRFKRIGGKSDKYFSEFCSLTQHIPKKGQGLGVYLDQAPKTLEAFIQYIKDAPMKEKPKIYDCTKTKYYATHLGQHIHEAHNFYRTMFVFEGEKEQPLLLTGTQFPDELRPQDRDKMNDAIRSVRSQLDW